MLAESIVPKMLKTIVIPFRGTGCDSGADEALVGIVAEEEAPSKLRTNALRRVALICRMVSRSGVKSAAALRA